MLSSPLSTKARKASFSRALTRSKAKSADFPTSVASNTVSPSFDCEKASSVPVKPELVFWNGPVKTVRQVPSEIAT